MKKLFGKIKQFVKTHKWQTGVCAGALVVALGVGGVTYASQLQRVNNSQAALEILNETGQISTDKLQELNDNGGMVDFGEEIVDPNTGETVVLTVNENGTVQRTVVRDSSGNDTGAVVPVNHSEEYTGSSSSGVNSGGESGGSTGGDSPAAHSHNWIAHYTTGTRTVTTPVYHPAVTEWVCVKKAGNYCNACGAYIADGNAAGEHTHIYGHGGFHYEDELHEDRVVQAAYTENVVTQEQYQYVDYYYCSDCGQHQ